MYVSRGSRNLSFFGNNNVTQYLDFSSKSVAILPCGRGTNKTINFPRIYFRVLLLNHENHKLIPLENNPLHTVCLH